jgi:hypothetical protein
MEPDLERHLTEAFASIKEDVGPPAQVPSKLIQRARRRALATALLGSTALGGLAVAGVLVLTGVTRSSTVPSAAPSATASPSPTAFGLPVDCLDPDPPGLISCQQAVSVALDRSGSPSVPDSIDARLSTYQPPDGGDSVTVWVVSFHGVKIYLDTVEGGCIVGDWDVYIDAVAGSYLFATHTPPASPCP